MSENTTIEQRLTAVENELRNCAAKRESRRDWAVRRIVEFVEQEFRWAEDVRKRQCVNRCDELMLAGACWVEARQMV